MPAPRYSKDNLAFAKLLRQDSMPAERALWDIVRAGKLGARFRRQQPIGPFVADFYCAAAGLVVELDGKGHDAESDARRSDWLVAQGYCMMRFTNGLVLNNPHDVYLALTAALHPPHPGAARHPSPSGGEGKMSH